MPIELKPTCEFFRMREVTPSNDHFSTRQVVAGNNITVYGTIRDATREGDEPEHFFSIDQTVWYSWTAPANGYVFYWVLTGYPVEANFYPYLTVYTGNSLV